jgi:hypothetical protein
MPDGVNRQFGDDVLGIERVVIGAPGTAEHLADDRAGAALGLMRRVAGKPPHTSLAQAWCDRLICLYADLGDRHRRWPPSRTSVVRSTPDGAVVSVRWWTHSENRDGSRGGMRSGNEVFSLNFR